MSNIRTFKHSRIEIRSLIATSAWCLTAMILHCLEQFLIKNFFLFQFFWLACWSSLVTYPAHKLLENDGRFSLATFRTFAILRSSSKSKQRFSLSSKKPSECLLERPRQPWRRERERERARRTRHSCVHLILEVKVRKFSSNDPGMQTVSITKAKQVVDERVVFLILFFSFIESFNKVA